MIALLLPLLDLRIESASSVPLRHATLNLVIRAEGCLKFVPALIRQLWGRWQMSGWRRPWPEGSFRFRADRKEWLPSEDGSPFPRNTPDGSAEAQQILWFPEKNRILKNKKTSQWQKVYFWQKFTSLSNINFQLFIKGGKKYKPRLSLRYELNSGSLTQKHDAPPLEPASQQTLMIPQRRSLVGRASHVTVQLYWREFESLPRHKVVVKNPSRGIRW